MMKILISFFTIVFLLISTPNQVVIQITETVFAGFYGIFKDKETENIIDNENSHSQPKKENLPAQKHSKQLSGKQKITQTTVEEKPETQINPVTSISTIGSIRTESAIIDKPTNMSAQEYFQQLSGEQHMGQRLAQTPVVEEPRTQINSVTSSPTMGFVRTDRTIIDNTNCQRHLQPTNLPAQEHIQQPPGEQHMVQQMDQIPVEERPRPQINPVTLISTMVNSINMQPNLEKAASTNESDSSTTIRGAIYRTTAAALATAETATDASATTNLSNSHLGNMGHSR